VSTHTYVRKTIGTALANPSDGDPTLMARVAAALPGKGFTARFDGTVADLVFADLLTGAEIVALDAAYAAWEPEDLTTLKSDLCTQIDQEVDARFERGPGFEFPPSTGIYYSFSLPAQAKWSGLYALRAHPAITYPIRINTYDDTGYIDIPDADTVESMYLCLAGTVMAYLNAGVGAKSAVQASTTRAAAEAAADAYLNP